MNVAKLALASYVLVMMEGSLFAHPPLKVLFIGNSQMQCYDLPQMIKIMSESAPAASPRIAIGRALMGGKGLKGFWEAGEAQGSPRGMIRAEKWDYVVIQEIFNAKEQ